MLKKIIIFCFFLIFILTGCPGESGAAGTPVISATTGVLLAGETGQVLYEKNMHQQRYPASTTKILTAIVAIDQGNLEDRVKISTKAAYQEGSSLYLKPGEEYSLEELLYGILLASGNDAAVAIAEHIAGSVEEFAVLMNQKAAEIGTRNSNFLNPSGLPQPGHVSTAYDLALIMRYGLQNEVFAEMTATKHKTISWPGETWDRGLRNHNKLLWSYQGATGGKTGYTRAAGRCLVASAARGEREQIAVVLNGPQDWLDIKKLFDFGFDNFRRVQVIEKGELIFTMHWEEALEKQLGMKAEDDVYVIVPAGEQLKITRQIIPEPEIILPVRKGQKIASLIISHNGHVIKEISLSSDKNLNFASVFKRMWYNIMKFVKKG